MSVEDTSPLRYGPDEYGVVCYTTVSAYPIGCVQVQEGKD